MQRACGGRGALLAGVVVLAAGTSLALETDQYYAWNRELTDATEVLNAKINLEIQAALDQINRNDGGRGASCDDVARKIASPFRQFVFQEIELWTTSTPLVSRVPATPEEELAFRQHYLYQITGPLDLGTKVPPSPTIEVNGVRIGTDKLSHFFSEGFKYHRNWVRAARKGLPAEAVETRVLRRGVFYERTILGLLASGVFSRGDLEANYGGMRFFNSLCETEPRRLVREGSVWRMHRPFDIAEYVTPEWDESYQVPIYSRSRWKKVRPVLENYCAMLHEPAVRERFEAYGHRDETTPTEVWVNRLVAEDRLPDPDQFTMARVCGPAGVDLAAAP